MHKKQFIDIDKACDRIPLQDVWRCMMAQDVPGKYGQIATDTHEEALILDKCRSYRHDH